MAQASTHESIFQCPVWAPLYRLVDRYGKGPSGLVPRQTARRRHATRADGVKLNLSNPEVHDKIVSDWHQAWQKAPEENKILPIGPNELGF